MRKGLSVMCDEHWKVLDMIRLLGSRGMPPYGGVRKALEVEREWAGPTWFAWDTGRSWVATYSGLPTDSVECVAYEQYVYYVGYNDD